MKPAIIWGAGNLGRALARSIAATPVYDVVAVVETNPPSGGRRLSDLGPGLSRDVPIYPSITDCATLGPATVFHATTSAVEPVMQQILSAIEGGHSVISAAEWLFHPWLRFGGQAAILDTKARAANVRVLGCGINPGFCFEALPILLARTVHSITDLDIRRVSNAGGVGPSDFAHLGFGLPAEAFFAAVAAGAIEGHMGFPESVAALAEGLDLSVDVITDHLEPTLAVRPLALSHRLVAPGEVVGITQTATGASAGVPVIRMTLEMFLDPAGYGRSPHEAIVITGSRSFTLNLAPAAPPVDGAAAMMVQAGAALEAVPHGLVSLLDLPLAAPGRRRGLQAVETRRDRQGTALSVASPRALNADVTDTAR